MERHISKRHCLFQRQVLQIMEHLSHIFDLIPEDDLTRLKACRRYVKEVIFSD
jgi:hypothetical protein